MTIWAITTTNFLWLFFAIIVIAVNGFSPPSLINTPNERTLRPTHQYRRLFQYQKHVITSNIESYIFASGAAVSYQGALNGYTRLSLYKQQHDADHQDIKRQLFLNKNFRTRNLIATFKNSQHHIRRMGRVRGYFTEITTTLLRLTSESSGDNFYDDFGNMMNNQKDDNANSSNSDEDNNKNNLSELLILEQLRRRIEQVQQHDKLVLQNIRTANCTSTIGTVVPDWVRRIYIPQNKYPLVVCGSASGTIYVSNLETGTILAKSTSTSTSIGTMREEHTIRLLYGQYDGGGTISVAMIGNMILEGRRSGGVHIWTWENQQKQKLTATTKQSRTNATEKTELSILKYHGSIPGLDDCIATSLVFDDGTTNALEDGDHNIGYEDDADDDDEEVRSFLWIGTDTGRVLVYTIKDDDDNENSSFLIHPKLFSKPSHEWILGVSSAAATTTIPLAGSTNPTVVLSVSVCASVPFCAIATTESGYVHLLCIEPHKNNNNNNDIMTNSPGRQFMPPFDGTERRSTRLYPTCAVIVPYHKRHSSVTSNTTSMDEQTPNSSNVSYSIVVGCSDGSMYIQPINTKVHKRSGYTVIDIDHPFEGTSTRTLMPSHFGPVKCVVPILRKDGKTTENGSSTSSNETNNNIGLFVTAGVDGSLRVWDITRSNKDVEKTNLYQFLGYKVWIGSVWTDGKRIVTDGADNTIIVHDFSPSSSIPDNNIQRRGGNF